MFETPAQFSMHIEQLTVEHGITHMDAVLQYCEENSLEPDEIKSLVNRPLRDKIESNMREINLLPKQATLEFE